MALAEGEEDEEEENKEEFLLGGFYVCERKDTLYFSLARAVELERVLLHAARDADGIRAIPLLHDVIRNEFRVLDAPSNPDVLPPAGPHDLGK